MNYYLAKTEPSTYSISDFQKEKITLWDGVHNYQAIAVIKTMQPGDTVYIYHSVKEKRIVGQATVLEPPFENTADERHSWAVKLQLVSVFDGPTLADCKSNPECADFLLVTHSRLSVMQVPVRVVEWINSYL